MRFTLFTVAAVALVSQSQAINIESEYINHNSGVKRSLGAAQVIGAGLENVLDMVGLGKPDPKKQMQAQLKAANKK